jgi:N6-L-threonylcarbamoyladenine synthase
LPKTIVLAGGVAANTKLQMRLAEALTVRAPKATLLTPAIEFATDNGAMIAAAGAVRFLLNKKRPLVIDPHLPL